MSASRIRRVESWARKSRIDPKRIVFHFFLNEKMLSDCFIFSGREFQMDGAALLKPREAKAVRRVGTTKRLAFEERSWRDGVYRTSRDAR